MTYIFDEIGLVNQGIERLNWFFSILGSLFSRQAKNLQILPTLWYWGSNLEPGMMYFMYVPTKKLKNPKILKITG